MVWKLLICAAICHALARPLAKAFCFRDGRLRLSSDIATVSIREAADPAPPSLERTLVGTTRTSRTGPRSTGRRGRTSTPWPRSLRLCGARVRVELSRVQSNNIMFKVRVSGLGAMAYRNLNPECDPFWVWRGTSPSVRNPDRKREVRFSHE